MTSDAIREKLAAMTDQELLDEWDRVTELDPPDYRLEGQLDAEMVRRVGEPSTYAASGLAQRLDNQADAQKIKALTARHAQALEAIESALAFDEVMEKAPAQIRFDLERARRALAGEGDAPMPPARDETGAIETIPATFTLTYRGQGPSVLQNDEEE